MLIGGVNRVCWLHFVSVWFVAGCLYIRSCCCRQTSLPFFSSAADQLVAPEPTMASKSARNEPIRYNNEEIRIVLVGKTGAGKSAAGNTILGNKSFKSKFSAKSLTVHCGKDYDEVDGQKVAVIDTPGLFDTSTDEHTTHKDIIQCIKFAAPGPHIFLVVIKLGRFTEEEKNTVQKIQKLFGKEADKYSMVLFTHGDQLEEETIEDFVAESEELQELVARCNGQYHVFNNNLKGRSQVTELLNKIRDITEKNGGSHYTNEMFQAAEKEIEEEKERILKEKEEEMRKEREELEKKIMEKYEKKMKDEMERQNELRAQHEREMEEKIREMKEKQEEAEMKRQNELREQHERESKAKRRKMQKEAEMEKQNELRAQREREIEEKIREMKEKQEEAEMKKQNELMAQRQREIEEKMREMEEKQEREAREEAERNPTIGTKIGKAVDAVLSVFKGWF